MNYKVKYCEACGKIMTHYHGCQKYHPECTPKYPLEERPTPSWEAMRTIMRSYNRGKDKKGLVGDG